jgi:DNA-binding MarR family transcriptional regulator
LLIRRSRLSGRTLDGWYGVIEWKARSLENQFTKLQGQYLAFVVAYVKLNRRAPAEADFQRYFDVTPPSVHNMILTLERRGLIKRTPGRARSIEVLVPLSQVPPLD